jgi:hypothetical protein
LRAAAQPHKAIAPARNTAIAKATHQTLAFAMPGANGEIESQSEIGMTRNLKYFHCGKYALYARQRLQEFHAEQAARQSIHQYVVVWQSP